MSILTVLYGTQTGLAERMAYTLASFAIKRGFKHCRCLPADEFPLEEWSNSSPLVIICSNSNQGEAPESIRVSWLKLLHKTAPSMEGLQFAIFGVGDSLYQKFNYMAKMLHNRLKQLGGLPIINRGLGDESDAKGVDEVFLPWMIQLWRALGKLNSDEDNIKVENISTVKMLRKFNINFYNNVNESNNQENIINKNIYRNEKMFNLVLQKNIRLTREDHFQAVHHLEFSRFINFEEEKKDEKEEEVKKSIPLSFDVGDALGIYCTNNDSIIEMFLDQIQEKGNTIICITPNTSEGLIQQRHEPFFGKPMELYYFLKHYIDLEAVVQRSFFSMLSNFTSDEEIKERLLELASPDNLDDFMSYCYREKRNVVEVLDDFRTVRPPLSILLSFIPIMRPRLFSISSSPSFDINEIHLTVAQLSWQTPYKRTRKGLCSTQLINSIPGDIFNCFLWSGTLLIPEIPTPLICVSTGTGIAPIRSLIRECVGKGSIWSNIPIFLFFGCRYEKKDYLYSSEWIELSKNYLKLLNIFPAFSRDGDKKFYVQHQLGQYAKRVAHIINEGAYIYVCGNSTPMPKDVAFTFEDIITQCCCNGDEKRSQEYMKELRKQGRYIVDTWSA